MNSTSKRTETHVFSLSIIQLVLIYLIFQKWLGKNCRKKVKKIISEVIIMRYALLSKYFRRYCPWKYKFVIR
jgi:hypothetical protein